MSQMRTIRGWVSGRVQGVAYRASCKQEADRLGVHGWVRNLADGRVEFLASADAPTIDQFLQWARRGPRFARVDELFSEESDDVAPQEFGIRR